MEEKYNLSRFTDAHRDMYKTALAEIRSGYKKSHWIWYIFPQVRGLGSSLNSHYYAIQSLEESAAFLEDPYLGGNLHEICDALLQLETDDPTEVLGSPDDKKLRSSMTLFACAAGENSVFHKVLDKYFNGKYDERTLRFLDIV